MKQSSKNTEKSQAILEAMTPEMRATLEKHMKTMEKSKNQNSKNLAKEYREVTKKSTDK